MRGGYWAYPFHLPFALTSSAWSSGEATCAEKNLDENRMRSDGMYAICTQHMQYRTLSLVLHNGEPSVMNRHATGSKDASEVSVFKATVREPECGQGAGQIRPNLLLEGQHATFGRHMLPHNLAGICDTRHT
eukprot:53806-Pelagomonas_calceolata.AAC.4